MQDQDFTQRSVRRPGHPPVSDYPEEGGPSTLTRCWTGFFRALLTMLKRGLQCHWMGMPWLALSTFLQRNMAEVGQGGPDREESLHGQYNMSELV